MGDCDARLVGTQRLHSDSSLRFVSSRRATLIRFIRLLGASIGALLGLGFVLTQENMFDRTGSAVFVIPVWVVAWTLVGFLILPYLTVVPVGRIIKGSRRCRRPSSWPRSSD